MEVSTASYVTTLVIGIIITLVVGQLFRRAGYRFLEEVYGDRTSTTRLGYLLVTLFHLIALGLVFLVSTANLGLDGIQLIITKTGIFLLVLGGVYGLAVLALATARNRRREEVLEDSIRPPRTDRGSSRG
jgi:hypothetical protein